MQDFKVFLSFNVQDKFAVVEVTSQDSTEE